MNPEQKPTPAQNGIASAVPQTSQIPNGVITPGTAEFGSLEPDPANQPNLPLAGLSLNEPISAVPPQPPVSHPKEIKSAPGIPKVPFIIVGLVLACAIAAVFLMNRHRASPQLNSQGSGNSSNTLGDVSAESVTFGIDTKIVNGKKFMASGPVTFKNDTDSTSAFSVQDASGASLINVDTKTGTVTISGKLNAANIVSPSSQLNPNVTQAGNTFNGASQLVKLGPSGILPVLNGSALVALNASNISTGVISDARLSSNVSLKNTNNNTFKPTADSTNTFQVQNAAGTASLFIVDTSNRRVAINQSSASYTLDVNGDINVTAGGSIRVNGVALCSGAGCTAASGSGSYIQNRTSVQSANFAVQSADINSVAGLVKGASGQVANVFQVNDGFNDAVFSVGPTGNVLIQPSTDSTNAFWVQNAAGTSHLIGGDTVNDRVAIALPTPPTYTLDVGGDINSTTAIRVGGNIICSAGGCTPGAGSGNYIQNSTSLQTANFAIQSDANNHVVAVVRGASGQTADLFDLVAGDSGQNVAKFGARGDVTFQNATDNTTAFQVQNAAGSSTVFDIDTLNKRVGIGTSTTISLLSIGTNTTSASGGVTFGTDTSLYRSGTGALTINGTNGSGMLQAASAVGNDITGDNLILAGGAGTGFANGGNVNIQIAQPTNNANQNFITGANKPTGVAVDASHIYWYNDGNNRIARANLDGTGINQSFITATIGQPGSEGIAVNGSFIYWVNNNSGTIGRANLDGTGANNSFITGASNITGLAVDSNYIYWGNFTTNTIGRANLDGTGVNQSFITGLNRPNGVAVTSSYIYWASPNTNTIGRANLDGTGANNSFISATSAYALAVTSNYIYWAQGNSGSGTIGRANLDGSGIVNNYITGVNNSNSSAGVAIDTNNIYWSNGGANTIGRLRLNDSTNNAYSTVATISGVNGSALFQNAIDSTSAFQIQNLAGNSNLFIADTQNTRIGIGASPATSLLTIGTNTTTSTGGITFGTDTSLYRSGTGALIINGTNGSGTMQAATAIGSDAVGSNLILAGGQGTGAGSGGNINLQISKPSNNTNQSFIAGSSVTRAVAVNASFIYWLNAGASNTIGRANLDGTGVNNSFVTGLNNPTSIAIDSGHIYWTNINSGTIGRANLDGTGANQSFITGATNVIGIAVDSSHIYWGNNNTIGRANLDGTGVNFSFIAGVTNVNGVAVDASHLYWNNDSGAGNTVGRANLDGTGVNANFITGVTSGEGVAVDSSHIYWGNNALGTIGRANLDGTGVNQSFLSGGSGPYGVASNSSNLYWSNSTLHTVARFSAGSLPNSLSTVTTISGANGSALFQNALDSTTAFQIQNASGVSLLTADTANMQITLGSASPTPVILVLGVKNTSGDPAGSCTSGGIYYNSSSNQFRGCDNGAYNNLAGIDVVTAVPTTNLYDGRQVRIRAGSNPYDMLTLTYDATYSKWVSDQQSYTGIITQGTSYLGNANRSLGSNTAGTFIGLPVVPLRGPTNAGLHPQIRFMMSTYDNGSAHGTVSVGYHTSNNGSTMSGINSFATFIPTDSYPTSEEFEDSGWKDLSGYTNADNLEPDLYITASSSGASIGINNLTCYIRWVSN